MPPEEDQATATGDLHTKYRETDPGVPQIARG